MNFNQIVKSTFRMVWSYINHSQPIFAHLVLTKRCNLHCKMCNVWEMTASEVSTANMKRIIDRLDQLGVAILSFTGGEPFLRVDFGELVRYAVSKGLIVQVNTNGTLPISIYQQALDLPLHEIGVSLHSYRPSTHDMINGLPGSWEKAVKMIRFLKDNGKRVYIVCVISSANITEIPEIIHFCTEELGVSVGLQPAVMGMEEDGFVFRGKNPELRGRLELKDVEKALSRIPVNRIKRTRKFLKTAFNILVGAGPAWKCEGGRLFLAVMPDGQMGLCQDVPIDINLLDDNFISRYHSRDFRQSCENLADRCKPCVYACYYDLHNIYQNLLEGLDMWLRNDSLLANHLFLHFKLTKN